MTLQDRFMGSMFGWIVTVSLASHAVVIAWLPSAQRRASAPPPPPVFMEMQAPPDPPKPSPPEPEPEPVTEPVLSRTATVAAAPRAAPHSNAPPSTSPEPAGPVDFTSTVFSNDGAGIAIGGGGGGTGTGPAPIATARPAAPALRIVDAKSLAKKPRAPGLDAELERQYPPEARRSGISGSAVLRVRILPDGRIGPVRVVSSSWNGFGPACERTVRAAQWEPPIDRDGSAVTTEITYTCRFEVRS